MKRFEFTLKAVYRAAESEEKQVKARLERIAAQLNVLNTRLKNAQAEFDGGRETLIRGAQGGMNAEDFGQHAAYLEELSAGISACREEIGKVLAEQRVWIEEHIKARKKIKTLDKLRKEQYDEYLREVEKETAMEIGDVIAFRAVAGR